MILNIKSGPALWRVRFFFAAEKAYPAAEHTFSGVENTHPAAGRTYSAAGKTFPVAEHTFSTAENTYPPAGRAYSAAGKTFPVAEFTFSTAENTYPAPGELILRQEEFSLQPAHFLYGKEHLSGGRANLFCDRKSFLCN